GRDNRLSGTSVAGRLWPPAKRDHARHRTLSSSRRRSHGSGNDVRRLEVLHQAIRLQDHVDAASRRAHARVRLYGESELQGLRAQVTPRHLHAGYRLSTLEKALRIRLLTAMVSAAYGRRRRTSKADRESTVCEQFARVTCIRPLTLRNWNGVSA